MRPTPPNKPRPKPSQISRRVKRRRVRAQIRSITTAASANRITKVEELMNHELLFSSTPLWYASKAFIVGKLNAQQALASTSICTARRRFESGDMGRYASDRPWEHNGRKCGKVRVPRVSIHT